MSTFFSVENVIFGCFLFFFLQKLDKFHSEIFTASFVCQFFGQQSQQNSNPNCQQKFSGTNFSVFFKNLKISQFFCLTKLLNIPQQKFSHNKKSYLINFDFYHTFSLFR